MNWGEIIKGLNGAPMYLVIMLAGGVIMYYGTSRKRDVAVKDRKRLNTVGLILILGGVVLGAVLFIIQFIMRVFK